MAKVLPATTQTDTQKDQKHLYQFAKFLRYLLHRFFSEKCMTTAASLTFTTLLALVPLLVVILAIFNAFPAFNDYITTFKSFIITHFVPDTSGDVIAAYLDRFLDNAGKLTAVGIGGLIFSVILLMFTIENVINQIWMTSKTRQLLPRALIYWALLTLSPLVIGIVLSINTALFGNVTLLSHIPLLKEVLSHIGLLAFSILGLTLLYIAVPNCYVPFRQALTAACVIAFILHGMQTLFAFYIREFTTYTLIYGAFSSFPILLLWLYLCWALILLGAVLSASLPHWQQNDVAQTESSHLLEKAVTLLMLLDRAQHAGIVLRTDTLCDQLDGKPDQIHAILNQLTTQNWVAPTQDERWCLATSLDNIYLRTLFQLFVYPLPEKSASIPLQRIYDQIIHAVDIDLKTLQEQADPTSTRSLLMSDQ